MEEMGSTLALRVAFVLNSDVNTRSEKAIR